MVSLYLSRTQTGSAAEWDDFHTGGPLSQGGIKSGELALQTSQDLLREPVGSYGHALPEALIIYDTTSQMGS